jgi:hypothetical protein
VSFPTQCSRAAGSLYVNVHGEQTLRAKRMTVKRNVA